MKWTDCPVIEVVPGKMSGAPVLRHSRVRPQDLLANMDEGPAWLADAFRLPIDDVRAVLSFFERHGDTLPMEYLSPEHVAALGADIDWSACPAVESRDGEAVIRRTPVRPEYLVSNRGEGDTCLAETYGLPIEIVRAVLSYFDERKRRLAPAA